MSIKIMSAIMVFISFMLIAEIGRQANEKEAYANAMIEADNAYRAAINEPKQCKQTLEVCWQFLNHKLVTVK